MKIILIRHGKTKGNTEGRYIGRTDEPLSPEGAAELRRREYPPADVVISSPMLRCRQTAELIYGRTDEVYDGLRECDFGAFENKNYTELKDDEYYQRWIDSGGRLPFPDGESMESSSKRQVRAFEEAIKVNRNTASIAFIVHGGTIMAIMSKYKGGNFYDYCLKNGECMVIFL